MTSITEHQELIKEMMICTKCQLADNRTQVVVGDYGKLPICFIGEGPGLNEDKLGHPFVGRSGKLLDQMLDKIGLSRSQVSILNIVKCRPPENRTPTTEEMKICGSSWLDPQLQYLKPRLIVPLGSTALKYFLPKAQITRDNAKLLQGDGFQIFPLFHPSYILRQGGDGDGNYLKSFEKLRSEMGSLEKPHESGSILDDFFS